MGDLGGGYMYRCLRPFREFASSMVGGGLRGDHYLAWTSHRSSQRLAAREDGSHLVNASAYGPTVVQRQEELYEDLSQLCTIFSRSTLIIGGDFNITLAPEDRPIGMGGCDLGSAQL